MSRALKDNQLSFSIKPPFSSPFPLATDYMLFLKNIQHFPDSILCMKKFPSFKNWPKHMCFHSILFRTFDYNSPFSYFTLSQELYVSLIQHQSLSCYHSCVAHIETSLRMLNTSLTYLYFEMYKGLTPNKCLTE